MIKIAGWDIETTGKLNPDHRIIEICIMVFQVDPRDFSKTRWDHTYLRRINPMRSIEAKAFAVHGISQDDLKHDPPFEKVAPEIFEILNGVDIGVAHNGDAFDCPFLIQEFERVGHELPDFIPFDSMLEGRFATPYGKVPNLGELCFACGVEYNPEEAHAAKYDVEKMMECFFWGVKHDWFKIESLI